MPFDAMVSTCNIFDIFDIFVQALRLKSLGKRHISIIMASGDLRSAGVMMVLTKYASKNLLSQKLGKESQLQLTMLRG